MSERVSVRKSAKLQERPQECSGGSAIEVQGRVAGRLAGDQETDDGITGLNCLPGSEMCLKEL